MIQSVDSLKLAQEIEKQAAKTGQTGDILVQFNTAREVQKFGAAPEEANELIEGISKLAQCSHQGSDVHGALYGRSGNYPQDIC